MPDQMMLQIHEIIGHPLELDRILGDERNFAGTSFVTLDMFGSYRYGSELLDVSYDPARREQFASFAFDDEGTPAENAHADPHGVLRAPAWRHDLAARAQRAGAIGASPPRAPQLEPRRRSTGWQPERRARRLSLDDMIASIDAAC